MTHAPSPPATNRIDHMRPDAPERARFGRYSVGRSSFTLTNPGAVRTIGLMSGEGPATADRTLTLTLFYPAEGPVEPTPIQTLLRDGVTPITLHGQSSEEAAPAAAEDGTEGFPLVLISHGYPGNRFLMSHLAENLASKGYAVASIDHAGSTYDDMGPPEAVLVDRPSDIQFVLDHLTTGASHPALESVSTDSIGLVGYSMGGYGVLMAQGAGLSAGVLERTPETAQALVGRFLTGSDEPALRPDPRVKAVISIAPWGRQMGIIDPAGLARIETPLLIVGGSEDDTSGYETGIRQIWQDASGADRALLTFDHAQHNAAAPIPAPAEAFAENATLGWLPYEHYADRVWDSVRMNNILQGVATGFFDHALKGAADAPSLADACAEPAPTGTRMEFLARGEG